MSDKYILAIDQGTTSSRALLYDKNLKVIGQAQETFAQHYPKTDWVEHDLEEIWVSVRNTVQRCLDSANDPEFNSRKISAIAITNQRETFGLWERSTLKPKGRAIVWQCRRSQEICLKLRKQGASKKLQKITGLVTDPYFSGTKLKWIFDNNKQFLKEAQSGQLCFGTIDTFLIAKLTGGRNHVTDTTNASRTLLMDLKTGKWSPTALKILKIPPQILPEIRPSDACFGETRGLGFLPDGIPLVGVLGDQQAALFGQNCFARGEGKVTYGTGAFFLLNIGQKPKFIKSGLTTVAWQLGEKRTYALEGSVFIAGAAVQFLRDGLNLIKASSEIETLAKSVPDSDGVFFIPSLSGLGSPHWIPSAKGLMGGFTRRSTRAHLARATLEGIAHSISDTFGQLLKESGQKLLFLKVDGGAAQNSLLLQIQADQLQTPIVRPQDTESTVRGVASLAALALGWVKKESELAEFNPPALKVKPLKKPAQNKNERDLWKKRVQALILIS